MIDKSTDLNWGQPKMAAFRFCFLFLVLFITFNNNGAFPLFENLISYPTQLLHQFVPWFSSEVLHYNYDFSIFPNGSGDTSYNYVLLLILFITSIIGCVLWSVFDRKRTQYNTLYYWLIVLVRFYLAFTLIMYGFIKVIKLQFQDPTLSTLLQPFGDASPMGLAWTFLGLSKGYNIFMGIVEISSALLFFRRTMIFGAILSLAACVHVMAMNYFFDVPVKIVSTMLVLMSLFILAPYFVNIFRFFFNYELQQLSILKAPTCKKRWLFIGFRAVKYLSIVWILSIMVNGNLKFQKVYGANAKKPYLYGIYEVENYKLNGKIEPPLTTNLNRWKQLIVQRPNSATVKLMNDSLLYLNLQLDTNKRQVDLVSQDGLATTFKFKYNINNPQRLVLVGSRNQDSLSITLDKRDLKKFKLTNRGFHWINEYPYNK